MATYLGKSCAFGKTVGVFHERLSISVCNSSPFGFEDEMLPLIVLIPDHCYLFTEQPTSLAW